MAASPTHCNSAPVPARPAPVIRTRATPIVRLPACTRSAVAVASPAVTIASIAEPCAIMIASVQPSRHDASSSSARGGGRAWGGGGGVAAFGGWAFGTGRQDYQIPALAHKSPSLVRFRVNRTLSRHRRMTECDPYRPFHARFCRDAQRNAHRVRR
jgi:hypothetical protein